MRVDPPAVSEAEVQHVFGLSPEDDIATTLQVTTNMKTDPFWRPYLSVRARAMLIEQNLPSTAFTDMNEA